VALRTDSGVSRDPASFRDRSSAVYVDAGAVRRGLDAAAQANWERLGTTGFFPRLLQEGLVVATDACEAPPECNGDWAGWLRHARVPFVSYPYEWPFGMLRDAALLHLSLMRQALEEDFILKDSSAYNVQWYGARPVFIDIPSFEPYSPGAPWVGYRQFCEMFLFPLMLTAYRGVRFQPWLRGSFDGIPVDQMAALFSHWRDRMRRGVFGHVYLQAALQRRYAGGAGDGGSASGEVRRAGFHAELIRRNVDGLTRLVGRLEAPAPRSGWTEYARTHSYPDEDFRRKQAFVESVASRRRWSLVWDLGCNTGAFSRIVAEHAECVVAMDGDHDAVELLYRSERDGGGMKILALNMNLADPSPGLGWRGGERRALIERGQPDLVLCLALVHHLVIGANIPLAQVVDWLASLGGAMVIEFVDKQDEMSQRLLRDRVDQHFDYDRDTFVALLERHFRIEARETLKQGHRELFYVVLGHD